MRNRILIIILLIAVCLPLCSQIRLAGYQGKHINSLLYFGQWACSLDLKYLMSLLMCMGCIISERLLNWMHFLSNSIFMYLLIIGINYISMVV